MKKAILLGVLCLSARAIFAQVVPDEVTFHFVQSKDVLGTKETENDPQNTCVYFKKVNNNITGLQCLDNSKAVIYTISGVQSEKRETDIYTISYFGYQYFAGTPIYSFLTYGYSYVSAKWTVTIENVLDNDQDGVSRILFKYFNIN